jgi:hypothetical protein
VIIASQTSITRTGTVTAAGGNGGNGIVASGSGGGGGGGGGGGYIITWSPSNSGAGTRTVTGGSAGSNGGLAAAAGATGVSKVLTGTPNLPLLGWMQEHISETAKLSPESNNRELAKLAAGNDLALFWQYRSGSLSETCEAIGDSETLANIS